MRYLWDEDNNRVNVQLHGITSEDAARIFEGPTVEQVDDRFDYGEVRIYAIGHGKRLRSNRRLGGQGRR